MERERERERESERGRGIKIQNHKCELLGCCVLVVGYYKNPAASDPLLPDLQMDRAAQPSCSYKISLAWRYNSFFLYVSCQINLASFGCYFSVSQTVDRRNYKSCVSPPVPERAHGNKLVCPSPKCHRKPRDTFRKCTLKSDP